MNHIHPEGCEAVSCHKVSDQAIIAERYQEMLGDESKLRADGVSSIYFPSSAAEICWALQDIGSRGESCVVSAGRTGIAGGASPIGAESIISLDAMKKVLGAGRDGDEYYIRIEPALSLAMLTGLLMKGDFAKAQNCTAEESLEVARIMEEEVSLWFPVNPTETSAHIGGIVATNASGARTYRYGSAREWVRGLTVVLPDGRVVKVRRGEIRAENGLFTLHNNDGSTTEIRVPDVKIPQTKATLGYPLAEEMDLVDLFIGSEGTLGVIAEVELRLALRPQSVIGALAIAPDEPTALKLVQQARNDTRITFDAIEYFDPAAFALLKKKKDSDGSGSHIPDLPNWNGCGVYFEFSGSEEETEDGCMVLEEILEQVGLSLDDTWAAMEPAEMAAQRVFRHAVPEAVNSIIGQRIKDYPGLHKVGTDMAVPDEKLEELFAMYRRDLAATGIESVVFGHIGNNHVHVNLLPENMEQLADAKEVYLRWAQEVVAMGGAVAAEHGIGRMKTGMLTIQYDEEVLSQMRRVRSIFDPAGLLAPGVLFS